MSWFMDMVRRSGWAHVIAGNIYLLLLVAGIIYLIADGLGRGDTQALLAISSIYIYYLIFYCIIHLIVKRNFKDDVLLIALSGFVLYTLFGIVYAVTSGDLLEGLTQAFLIPLIFGWLMIGWFISEVLNIRNQAQIAFLNLLVFLLFAGYFVLQSIKNNTVVQTWIRRGILIFLVLLYLVSTVSCILSLDSMSF